MLESKKYNLIEWIISVADEKIIDTMNSFRENLEASSSPSIVDPTFSTSSYTELLNNSVNIEELKKQQDYLPSSVEDLHKIAQEANIEQSIDALLTDLKEMG